MKRELRRFTAAIGLLMTISVSTDAVGQKPGGVLRVLAGAAPHVAAALCLAGVASVETVEAAPDLEELFLRHYSAERAVAGAPG